MAAQEAVHPEDLWDLPLLISRQSLAKESLSKWLRRDLESLNIVATYNLVYNASLLVEEGLGYALCLDKLINTAESSLCFRPLDPPLEAAACIVWKKYQLFSKAAEVFLRSLHGILEESAAASSNAP